MAFNAHSAIVVHCRTFFTFFVAVNIAATGEAMDSNFAGSDVSLVFRTATIFTVLIIHFILFIFSRKKEAWIDSSSACFNSRLLR